MCDCPPSGRQIRRQLLMRCWMLDVVRSLRLQQHRGCICEKWRNFEDRTFERITEYSGQQKRRVTTVDDTSARKDEMLIDERYLSLMQISRSYAHNRLDDTLRRVDLVACLQPASEKHEQLVVEDNSIGKIIWSAFVRVEAETCFPRPSRFILLFITSCLRGRDHGHRLNSTMVMLLNRRRCPSGM